MLFRRSSRHRLRPGGVVAAKPSLLWADAVTAPKGRDPTRTVAIRRAFKRDVERRLRELKKMFRHVLVEQDILGLGKPTVQSISFVTQINSAVIPRMMAHLPDDRRVLHFYEWANNAIYQVLIPNGGYWVRAHIKRAYDYGVRFATAEAKAAPLSLDPKRADIIGALTQAELQGAADATVQRIGRVVSDAILHNQKPKALTVAINKQLDEIASVRLAAMVNQYVVKAFNEAKLDVYEALGIRHVGILPETRPRGERHTHDALYSKFEDARRRRSQGSNGNGPPAAPTPSERALREIGEQAGMGPALQTRIERRERRLDKLGLVNVLTAGDDLVCIKCEDISEEGPYTIDEARGLIPAHPNCRCAFIPADADFDPNDAIYDVGWTEEARRAALEARQKNATLKSLEGVGFNTTPTEAKIKSWLEELDKRRNSSEWETDAHAFMRSAVSRYHEARFKGDLRFVAAEREGKLIAAGLAHFRERFATITDLGSVERGAGAVVLKALELGVAKVGVQKVMLEASFQNKSFYERNGYAVEEDKQDGTYKMAKWLPKKQKVKDTGWTEEAREAALEARRKGVERKIVTEYLQSTTPAVKRSDKPGVLAEILDPARAHAELPRAAQTEEGAERYFHSVLITEAKWYERHGGGHLPFYHEVPGDQVASVQEHGIKSDYGTFASIKEPSGFVTSDVKTVVEFALPRSELAYVHPDMMYHGSEDQGFGPHQMLILSHGSKLRGAYISYPESVPKEWIKSVKLVRKTVEEK